MLYDLNRIPQTSRKAQEKTHVHKMKQQRQQQHNNITPATLCLFVYPASMYIQCT